MASAESSASLHAAHEAALAVHKVKKSRKTSIPVQKAPGTGKRVTAPKAKKGKGNWLAAAQAKSLAAREVKESKSFAALKDKKRHLIRGVCTSNFDENKFAVWIAGRGEDGTFESADGFELSLPICTEHKSLLENLASQDPFKPNYPQNTIQMVESKLFPAKEDSTVAWKSAIKVKFEAIQQASGEAEDAEMTEEE